MTPASRSPAVVVGADRVVANGDTANKVGTYQLAIAAKHHGIPFYVAAPSSSCDLCLETGREIVIEERPGQELTDVSGVRVAAPGKPSAQSGGASVPGQPAPSQGRWPLGWQPPSDSRATPSSRFLEWKRLGGQLQGQTVLRENRHLVAVPPRPAWVPVPSMGR